MPVDNDVEKEHERLVGRPRREPDEPEGEPRERAPVGPGWSPPAPNEKSAKPPRAEAPEGDSHED